VPYVVYPNPYAAQLTFSPSSDRLVWIELTTPERELSVESLSLREMWLQSGEGRTVVSFDVSITPPSLPFIGPWLSDDLLVVEYAGQSWLVDVVSGQAMVWSPQVDGVQVANTVGILHVGE
jgi:hypothetical protein